MVIRRRNLNLDVTIWVVIVIGLVSWGFVAMWQKGIGNFWRCLAETNERHGTSFGTSPEDQATVIGVNLYKGGAFAFDQTNRKIAYVTKGGKSVEILTYDFVQSWQVTWRERTTGSGAQFGIVAVGSAEISRDNVFLEIATNDIKRPLIKMPMSSVRYAQDTAARLKLMINAKV